MVFRKEIKFISLFFAFLFFAFFLNPFFIHGQTADELQEEILQRNSDIERIEQEIEKYKNELSKVSRQKSTLSSEIKEMDLTRKKLSADINLTESKISRVNLEIESLGGEISNKEKSISNDHVVISEDVRNMYELEQVSLFELVFSGKDLAEIWREIDQMMSLRKALLLKIDKLKDDKQELVASRGETVKAKEELVELRSDLADQKSIVEQNKNSKNKLLSEAKNSESGYQKLLTYKKQEQAEVEKELEEIESRLRFILDPNALPGPGSLSWPLDKIYITQLFGKTADSGRLYASGTHSGVDFRASVGTKTYSMASGVVRGVGDTDSTCSNASFGKWVFVEFDNGLSSTYGHLSLIKVKEGQRVKKGDLLGYTGRTGRVTGPHLHITVYAPDAANVKTFPSKSCPSKTLTQPLAARNAYLDPMVYLPSYE